MKELMPHDFSHVTDHTFYNTRITYLALPSSMAEITKKYAVVTGANKGIGFEISRQLASQGITVVLTDRDDKRGPEALQKLKGFGLSDHVIFHRLDVTDLASVLALAEFIRAKFGKLDILVNNAGVSGVVFEGDRSLYQELIETDVARIYADGKKTEPVKQGSRGRLIQTFQDAEECIKTNYYGAKMVTEALIPLLELSNSPRIVNVSSLLGNLQLMTNEWAKGVLSNEESLTEESIDEVVQKFLKDFKEGCESPQAGNWPAIFAAYKVSKAALTAYTRVLAKKYPSFLINSVGPGFVKTDITFNLGPLDAEEGAKSPVALALLPDGGPSGLFFSRKEIHPF